MARPKNDPVLLSRNDILELAKNTYGNVKYNLENDPDCSAKNAYNKHINETLKNHKLIPEKTTTNEEVISKEIATFVVEDLLYDYFAKEPKSRRQKREEWEEKQREKIRERSREKDRMLNETQQQSHEAWAQITEKEYEGNYVDEEEFLEGFSLLSKNNPDTDPYRYPIPDISDLPVNGECQCRSYSNTIDQTVDRLMLRAIFDIFYDFNEIKYRRDFLERSKLVNTEVEPNEFGEGYSELTMMLENPLKYYVSRKESPKEKTPKNSNHILDPDSQKRLKQYADEHGISVSDAIRNLIQDQPSKRGNK